MNTAIRNTREKLSLTQAQVAQKAGIPERSYQNYEYGERIPDAYTAIRLAKALNTSVEQLFTVADENNLSSV